MIENEEADLKTIESQTASQFRKTNRQIITVDRLVIGGLALLSIFAGLLILFLPDLLRPALIAVPPAIVLGYIMFRNPYIGVDFFFLYSFLRPYEFIPALVPLRITLVIEVVTVLSWAMSLVVHKQRIRWSAFHTLFAMFVAVIAITVFTAANNFLAFNNFQVMIVLFVMFVVSAEVVNTPDRLKYIVWMMLLVHAFFALKGISTFLSGSFQGYKGNSSGVVGGNFWADENDFALAINVMIPFGIFGFLFLKRFPKMIAGALLLIFVMAVIASVSRGGLVGLSAIFIFLMLISKRKLMTFGVAVAVAITMIVFAPSSYWKVAETTGNTDQGTANERLLYWATGMRMFAAYPIIGVGAGNGGVHMGYFYEGPRNAKTQFGRTFHGTWPQVLAETGLLGSIPYFTMIFLAFRYLFRVRRETFHDGDTTIVFVANSLIGSLIAYIGTATFLSTAYYPELWTTYTFMMIVIFCHERELAKHPVVVDAAPVEIHPSGTAEELA